METNLKIEVIEQKLADFFNPRNFIIVNRVSWGLLPYEADILVMSKGGFLTEIEIKRSWSDFIADF